MARSNILIIDESRLVPQKTIDTIFRPMNASPRQPGYLKKPEYAGLQEMNKEMYLSSAWYKASEMFDKVKSYTANMLDSRMNYFVCDLPYQVSIKEGLLMRQQIQNEMSEATFSDITFMMERQGLFFGSSEDALFDYKVLSKRRILSEPLYDLSYYQNNSIRIPEKQKQEIRILSVDVALLASKKHNNDASALMIHSAVPASDNSYLDNIVYIDTKEGLVTDELGIIIMRYFYQYDCDYLVLDANGVGQSLLDFVMADHYDPMYGQVYEAINVIDNPELADRCKVKGAPKCVYAIKASGKFNNDACISLRAGFQNGNINLLMDDSNIEERLQRIRGYSKLSEQEQVMLKYPYIQTSFLINELINLTHDFSNGLIKVKEKSGMRKDRYSSCMYGYWAVQELSKKLKPKSTEREILDMITIRPAQRKH